MMKWKPLLVTVCVIVFLGVVNLFFLDFWVKRGVEKSLEMTAGAKVEIDSADFHFRPTLGITFKHIQIANKNFPFQNLIELDEAKVAIQGGPLLEKKVIIHAIGFTGLAMGTPRKTSGALPLKKKTPPSKLSKKMSELIAEQLDQFGFNKLVKPMPTFKVDTDHLLVKSELEKSNQLIKDKQKKWDENIKALQLDTRIRQVQDQTTELSKTKIDSLNSIQDVQKITSALNSVNHLLTNVQGIQKDVDARIQMAKSDYVDLAKLPGNIQVAANQDYENILDQLHVNDLKSGNFANLFFEESARQQINALTDQIQGLVEKAAQFKAPKPEIQDRYEGVDIHFGTPRSYPTLWVKLIHLSGLSKTGQSWDGKITDISSDQSKTKAPTIVDIRGQNVLKAGCQMQIYGKVDLRQTPMKNHFRVSLLNYRFDPYFLFKLKDQPVQMTHGVGQVDLTLFQSGKFFSGQLKTQLNQIQTDVSRIQTEALSMDRVLTSFVQKVDYLEISGAVKGVPGDIQLGLSSNIDALFKRSFDEILQEQLSEIRGRVQAEIDRYKAEAEKAVMDAISSEKKKIDDQLSVYTNQVKDLQSQLEVKKKRAEAKLEEQKQLVEGKKKELEEAAQKEIDAKKKEAEIKKKELEDVVKKEADAKKKAAEDAVKKEAENQIKKALPKFF